VFLLSVLPLVLPLWMGLKFWVSQPLDRLVRADQAFARGDLQGMVLPEESVPPGEIRELVRSRNEMLAAQETMAAQIQHRQASLLEISKRIQEIRQSSDMHGVVEVIYRELGRLKMDAISVAIHRALDVDSGRFESYEILPSGKIMHEISQLKNVLKIWRNGRMVYRPDLDQDAGGLTLERRQALQQRYGMPVRCILDVPHARGTLALLCDRKDAFSESDREFVAQVTGILSLGMLRVADLEALTEQEEKFHLISSAAHDAVVMMDTEKRVSFWNPAAERMFGYTAEEILGRDLHDVIVPDRFRDAFRHGFEGFAQTGTGGVIGKTVELQGLRKDGTEFPVELSLSSVRRENGWHAVGLVRDVSERKLAEQVLEKAEARWRFALEGSGDGVWDWDIPGNTVFFSARWKGMLGYEAHEVGNTFEAFGDLVHSDDLPRVTQDLERYFAGEAQAYEPELRMRCKDGSYKWILSRGKVTKWSDDHKPTRMLGTHVDLTEQKKMESAQREVERNRVLMETAGAAAHEVNQPLSVILGLVQLMQATLPEDHPNRQDVDYVGEAAAKIRDIIKQMEMVEHYSTRAYVGNASIVDFEAASGDASNAQ